MYARMYVFGLTPLGLSMFCLWVRGMVQRYSQEHGWLAILILRVDIGSYIGSV